MHDMFHKGHFKDNGDMIEGQTSLRRKLQVPVIRAFLSLKLQNPPTCMAVKCDILRNICHEVRA